MCALAVILMTVFHPAIFFPQISKKYVAQAKADGELGFSEPSSNEHHIVEKEPISVEMAQRSRSDSEEEVMERRDI